MGYASVREPIPSSAWSSRVYESMITGDHQCIEEAHDPRKGNSKEPWKASLRKVKRDLLRPGRSTELM